MADRLLHSSVPTATNKHCFSVGTVKNARYYRGAAPTSDHENEDVCFAIDNGEFQVCAVFDGHDSLSAAEFASESMKHYISSDLEQFLLSGDDNLVESKLKECFTRSDSEFFKQRRKYIEERKRILKKIPNDMKSYEAEQLYPHEVARLEELEPLISGGCTAVVAVICDRKLYVANVGDSRAIVVYKGPSSLETFQLSVDHDVKNIEELKRLEKLGLDPEELKRVGRLGPQENTRSIGDYNIKDGYKSVDFLSHASGPPGTAEPSVITVNIEDSFLYLMLMSDGVYKSIEAAIDDTQTTAAINSLVSYFHTMTHSFTSASETTLMHFAEQHKKAFDNNLNPNCHKRDDMTLTAYSFIAKTGDIDEGNVKNHTTEAGQKSNLWQKGKKIMKQMMQGLFGPEETSSNHRCPEYYSKGTCENCRYQLGSASEPDHANEDRLFCYDGGSFKAFAVFDGHDGQGAVDFAHKYFTDLFSCYKWKNVNVEQKLMKHFMKADSKYFESIKTHTDEKISIQKKIDPEGNLHRADIYYPHEVAHLAELEPLISGGCTAVVAVICDRKLYVANVGNSRAVIVYKYSSSLETFQLSVDHDVKNIEELKRLEKLGLDPEKLKRVGRIGPQENTRSIGDYNIKDGYKCVDILSHASGPPGTAEPSVITVDIEDSFLYLILMSDGVYKSIEAAVDEAQTTGANQYLAEMVYTCAQTPGVESSSVAKAVLDQVAHFHEEAYQKSAEQDVRSPKATACRKRDDMTLIVCTF